LFLGFDIGTSGVKAVLIDAQGFIAAEATAPLSVSRPAPLWSEQSPHDWVAATEAASNALPAHLRAGVQAIGFAGQMHGATLLGADNRPLRPAILWNDGRSERQCAELEARIQSLPSIAGNRAMPGFTAPKLLWVREHEPDVFALVRRVLLPKDYVRLVFTGDAASDMSDSAGTLWMDVARRDWSDDLLSATGLTRAHMPTLHEGTDTTGQLSASGAARLGVPVCPVVAGGGDNAAGAVAAGAASPGDAIVSLGTSGVVFTVTDGFRPNPDEATHAFCHALPGRWHQMAVILSAASAVDWAARIAGFETPAAAFAAAEAAREDDDIPVFLPYLSGERTPHNAPTATGAFVGLTQRTTPAAIVRAALEGVAFALADGVNALDRAGARPAEATLIGGGARSRYWGQMISTALDLPLNWRDGADAGPAFGAARLAQIGSGASSINDIRPGPVRDRVEPSPETFPALRERRSLFKALYPSLKPHLPRV
jgi:xylulokinase